MLRLSRTAADAGRDLARAAELIGDPLLRRLLLRHAQDEFRHAELFAIRGRALLHETARGAAAAPRIEANWLAPGVRGLNELRVDDTRAVPLLAFLHLSGAAAAGRFALYRELLDHDHATRDLFSNALRDEVFHMTYTRKQLARLVSTRQGRALWRARASRQWHAYLRVAAAAAGTLGAVMLTIHYFVLVPPFALVARRAARRDRAGWHARPEHCRPLDSQV